MNWFWYDLGNFALGLLWLVLWLGVAYLTGKIADGKGRAPGKWFVFGLIFPVIALVIVAIVDDYVSPKTRYGNPDGLPYEPDYTDPPVDPPPSENGRAS